MRPSHGTQPPETSWGLAFPAAIHGIIAGALWPIAYLLYIAGRIIYFTTFSGKP